ncbi:hypothetical protein ACFOZ1_10965 [Gracilibacillus marinus]|uniref:Permease n=1 Tax=Gracilibacillus marinus TaxID=630535 RepID=A0ABV8VUX6_9BACI
MISIIKRNVNVFFNTEMWIVILVFSIYSAYLKREAITFNLSYFEYLIIVMTDHYYILYFMILSFTYLIYKLYREDNEIILIRSKTYLNYYVAQIASLFIISMSFILIHLIIPMVIGIGIRFESEFTNLSIDTNTIIVGEFNQYFSNPFVALISIVFYLILGLTFLGSIFLFLNNFLTEKFVLIIIVCIYILMLLSIRSDVDSMIPFVFLNNYIILHHAFATIDSKYYLFIIVEVALLICMMYIMKKYWYKKLSVRFFNNPLDKWNLNMLFTKKNLIVIIVLSTFTVISIIIKYNNLTFFDVISIQFYGHGTGYFNFIYFISLVVYNGVPVYLLSYFLEKESINRSSVLTIRLQYKQIWLSSILRSSFIFILSYIILTITVTVIVSIVFGLSFNGYDYMHQIFIGFGVNEVNTLKLLLIIIISKALELYFSFLFIFTLFGIVKNATTGFVLLELSYLLLLIDAQFVKYIPIGMSSLLRIAEFVGRNGITYLASIGILLISICLLYRVQRKYIINQIF